MKTDIPRILFFGMLSLLMSCSTTGNEPSPKKEKNSEIDRKVSSEANGEEVTSNEKTTAEVLYFESTSPNAERKTSLYEYIKLSYEDGMIWGLGAGDFMEGSEPWTLSFSGIFPDGDEKNMELEVKYKQDGNKQFTEKEVWVLDIKNKRLYRPNWEKSDNQTGASEYHLIKASDLPEEYASLK
jgi:hypothetical protein